MGLHRLQPGSEIANNEQLVDAAVERISQEVLRTFNENRVFEGHPAMNTIRGDMDWDIERVARSEIEALLLARAEQADQDREDAVQAARNWLALDLHLALGNKVDWSEVTQQGRKSWSEWWSELLRSARDYRSGTAHE